MTDINLDPTQPDFKQQLEETLAKYAEEYSIEKFPQRRSKALGVGIIGKECWRQIWFDYRWVKQTIYGGRTRRLFNRGHGEEDKFGDFLNWCGFHNRSIDPKTGKQYGLKLHEGHFRGFLDNTAIVPWAKDLRLIVEYKTHNKKSFDDLKKNKLKASKIEHYAQMVCYGLEYNIKHGLYAATNKDDDEWYFEFIELDHNYALELTKKAGDIIHAKFPPTRIAENPAFYKCKFCNYTDICFHGAPVEINCRSCKNAEPIKDGKWHCNLFKDTIPDNFVEKGCDKHMSLMS